MKRCVSYNGGGGDGDQGGGGEIREIQWWRRGRGTLSGLGSVYRVLAGIPHSWKQAKEGTMRLT